VRIAVTGASGFIGREVLKLADFRGIEAVPVVRRDMGHPRQIIIGDIEAANVQQLSVRLKRIDAVVHLAARTHVVGADHDAAAKYFATNVGGARAIAQASVDAGVGRIVFVSSIKVNGEETFGEQEFSGGDIPLPEDDYGRTKLQAEELISALAIAAGTRVVILRPPMVYGAEVGGNFARLVSAIDRGMPLPFGLINNRRSLISVRNLAEAILSALISPSRKRLILTLSDGEEVSTRSLAEAIGHAIGRPARLFPVPPGALRATGQILRKGAQIRRLTGDLRVDCKQAQASLDWEPSEKIPEALERMFRNKRNG
jgi:UDP-glucose 4-epimerase|tara:strand:- start:3581 stop:4522 length:942 start_codon:yes stop_codon:yes gene_type:complete